MSARADPRAALLAFVSCSCLASSLAASERALAGAPRGETRRPAKRPAFAVAPPGPYARLLGGMAIGRGVRLNNPFRLSTQLGDTAESLSLTATYLDASVGAVLGEPGRPQHGAIVHGALALDGIAQEVVTPGYVFWWELVPEWAVFGRAGLPIVIEPDANVGYELGVGGVLWLTASWGLGAELVGSLFYGAGTPEGARTTIPIVSMQLSAAYQFEVLP